MQLAALQQPPKKETPRSVKSPDEKWTAAIKDFNVVIRDADGQETPLTKDGKEGAAYGMLSWSPDSKALVAFRMEAGDNKQVHVVRSSPPGGGRATLESRPYPLPGDKFDTCELHLFDVADAKELKVEVEKFESNYPFPVPRVRWNKDGAAFTVPKHDRGHQRFRLIEVAAHSGKTRNLIDEKSDTFIWLGHLEGMNLRTTTWLEKSDEIVYMSEKSGWRHLYLIDGKTGEQRNAITEGEWVVRGIDRIDEDARQIWFWGSGKNAGQDPYLLHYYRVNLDGTGLVALTEANGDHGRRARNRLLPPELSPGRKYLIDTYSRADAPPVMELRRTSDGKFVCKLEEADTSDLKTSGWEAPEVFTAKGRDGKTDIWGMIVRPRNFDPNKQYPVIEYIYAGPHDSHVPKAFSPARRFADLTALGFIVVQIDGMGTANRSKAFHDICWKNLKDAGFPDRILWHKAVAEKYPYYDASRIGIYGTSAGGQNAMGAVLFHGDFYKAAMAACGCHDNRMDKSSWNEQWMGYPVGPHYAACSNVDHASRLTGKLLLIVGEQDHNVPPESTLRVVDSLIKAGKDFDLLVMPGMDHSNGGQYGTRRMQDFFVRHLHGVEPPDRNKAEPNRTATEPELPVAVQKEEPKREVAPPPREKLDLAALISKQRNEAIPVVREYDADRGALLRTYTLQLSPTRTTRLLKFYSDWLAALDKADYRTISPAAREDILKLRERIEGERKELLSRQYADALIAPLIPFAPTIIDLNEALRRMEPTDPQKAAARIDAMRKLIEQHRAAAEASLKKGEPVGWLVVTKDTATQAARATASLRTALERWYAFHDGYDPLFTWWVAAPYKQADALLEGYVKFLTDRAKDLPEEADTGVILRLKSEPDPKAVSDVPNLADLFATPQSEFAPILTRYGGGFRGGPRPNPADRDPARWLDALNRVPFDTLSRPAQVDYVLFKTYLEREKRRAEIRAAGRRLLVPKDDTGIVGQPIGREAMMAELAGEMIPYTPEQLIELARAELEWCDAEMRKASREMGYGDDWRKATEKVKSLHVAPGSQPKLIRELSDEAVAYLKAKDLVTVPPLAEETWRMIMMTPERQLFSPFFTGGEVISVAFPTIAMSHDAKLQSLRGNNIHFARATVHHELIPGHHLQQFMQTRHNTQRGLFGTPFWTEGWALYWEFVLYEKGFPKTPEDRVGFLTWRKHRCARIIFSLGYHLGRMTPRECVDLLVDRVGFEPENATAEVRRSFSGGYGPLYQAAYMLGGKQLWSLRKELVGSGKMTDRQFHDAVLAEHGMPIAMVRAILTGQKLSADAAPVWKFIERPTAP